MAYTLTGEKCGTVRLDPKETGVVITETVQRRSKVTSNPIEDGADINDHVVNDPITLTITGITINGDGQAAILRRMREEKDVLEYVGRNRVSNCVITDLKTDTKAGNKTGAGFTLQLQVVKRTASEYVESGEQMMSEQDANASTAPSIGPGQTSAPKADGLKTTAAQTVSSSAYAAYVSSYDSKPASSPGPAARRTASFSAA